MSNVLMVAVQTAERVSMRYIEMREHSENHLLLILASFVVIVVVGIWKSTRD